MSDFQNKPINPGARVIDGRLGGLNFFMSKVFGDSVPNFNEFISVEDRVNGVLKCEFRNQLKVNCITNSQYNDGWSLMRPQGMYADSDIIMMLGMGTRDERNPVPKRLFVFRVGDVETKTIQTKVGEREATFFSPNEHDQWCSFACDSANVGMAIRSVVDGTVDPDLPAGPFKSYLTSVLSGEPMPTIKKADDQSISDWDDDIPF